MDLAWVYFLVWAEGLSYAARKWADWRWGPYKPQHRAVYLPGVFAGLALSAIGAFLWISTGPDPRFSGEFIRVGLRIAFLCFVLLTFLFDVAYWTDRRIAATQKGQAHGNH